MAEHKLKCLLGLGVSPAYYRSDEHCAVVEIDPDADDRADVFVDGSHVSGGKVSAVLTRHGVPLSGWTTKPSFFNFFEE